ncbi:reverse transcriptase domain-containing protein [Tanacetum coccineum]
MQTRASNSELFEPLPESEHTLNRRLCRRNRRVLFKQRNNPPQHSRIVYPLILDINYFRHFLDILQNYDPTDDEPMWAADRVVAPTPGSAITILETANEFAIKGNQLTLMKGNQFDGKTKTDPHKHIHEFLGICDMFKYRDTENEDVCLMMFPLSLTGETKTWLDELNEGTIEMWDELRTVFISRFFPPALFDRLLREIRAFSQHENESLTDAWPRMKEMLRNCHGHNLSKGNIIKIFYHGLTEIIQEVLNAAVGGSSNSDTDKIMARMDVMTMKMDAQYKDFQSHSKQSNLDDDDIPMSSEEEAKFMKTFHRIRFYHDYRDRDYNHDNWRSRGRNDYNRDNYQSHSDDKPDLQKQLSDSSKLNTQPTLLLVDKQSGRPSGSLPSNTQPNPKAKNMLVEVSKYNFPADFVILKREEDSKVPLILGRPFLHTVDALIRVKQKQLNLGVGTKRMIFHIDSVMKHSYLNDDTCFSIDVIDEILEEDFDALLDEEPPTDLELKPLLDNLEYVFLEEPSFLHVIISSQLSEENKNKLVYVLKRYKQAFAWKTTDIPGIRPSFCIIYLIADSPWVSPIHCVPKKGGITVVANERNELVPTRTVIGWRVCIDYRKLNEATAKDHFPLPFMDQMCMLVIFHDMIEESVEVFMDDFSVFGSSFDHCLNNLDKMLQRCKDAHLVLN